MVDVRQQEGREHRAVVLNAADRYAADSDTVIAALSADQLRALHVTAQTMIGHRDFQSRVHGLGAGVREKYSVQAGWRPATDARGQLECARVAELETGRVVERGNLTLDRSHDFRMAVSEWRAPQA